MGALFMREGCFVHERRKVMLGERPHREASNLISDALLSVEQQTSWLLSYVVIFSNFLQLT